MSVLLLPLLAIGLTAAQPSLEEGQAFKKAGDLPAARQAFLRAIKTSRLAALSELAQVDLALGRYSECISEASEAQSLFAAAGNRPDEAQMLTTSGIAQFHSGNFGKALDDFQKGLALARELGDRDGEVTRLNNIGNVYYAEGRYGEALRHYETAQGKTGEVSAAQRQLTTANLAALYQRLGQYTRALQLYQGMGQRTDLPARERAQMLSNMGTLYRRLGDPVTALETYAEAAKLYRTESALAGEVGVLNNIGIAQASDLSDNDDGVGTFTRALTLAESSGGKQLVMNCLLYRGEALLRAGKLSAAEADFQRTTLLAAELKGREEQWKAAFGLARIADLRHDSIASDRLLHEALRIIETMRQTSGTGAGRGGFLIERRDVYDLLIRHETRPEIMFQLMEQSRARELRDRLHLKPLRLDELQARLPPKALLLEYSLDGDSLVVLWATRDAAGFRKRIVGGIENAAIAFSNPARTDWRTQAAQASEMLLSGIDVLQNGGIDRIIVVADGELSRIPFEALPVASANGDLLIDRSSVSYLPCASLFQPSVEARRLLAPWSTSLIAFADPVAGTAAGTGMITPHDALARLPAAAQEVRDVAQIVGGHAVLYMGEAAQKAFLSSSAPLLHLATHAFADSENPDRSYVLFSPPARNSGYDYLFLQEAADLSRSFDLVTISACDSGLGKFAKGEGAQSFASAFLSGGSRAVVTSLWRIGDEPAAELMRRFYENMRSVDAAEALRNAKLAFRRSGSTSAHPAYWAGFVLTGNARMPLVIGWWTISGGCLIFAAAVVALVKTPARRG